MTRKLSNRIFKEIKERRASFASDGARGHPRAFGSGDLPTPGNGSKDD
jgi:hypothetical protein